MASPPFNIAETTPAASDNVSAYPAAEQLFRDIVESWLTLHSDPATGLLKASGMPTPLLESTTAGASIGPILEIYRNRTSAINDANGAVNFTSNDAAGNKTLFNWIRSEAKVVADGTEEGRMVFGGISGAIGDRALMHLTKGGMTFDDADNDKVDTINGAAADHVMILQSSNSSGMGGAIFVYGESHATNAGDVAIVRNNDFKYSWDQSDNRHEFYYPTYIASTLALTNVETAPGVSNNTLGVGWNGSLFATNTNGATWIGRTATGQVLVAWTAAGSVVGTVSESGGVVTYSAFMGTHWAEIVGAVPPKWSIMETVDEPSVYSEVENLRQPKVRVARPGSKGVYGVYFHATKDLPDQPEKHYIAGLGAGFIRIAKGQTVEIGDYIEAGENGAGVVMRNHAASALEFEQKRVAKVTATYHLTEYEDGSFVVPATLHAG